MRMQAGLQPRRISRIYFSLFLFALAAGGQTHLPTRAGSVGGAGKSGVAALLVSDIHFDPFTDPAKVQQLAGAPVPEWKGIFEEPASADQARASADLQRSCHVRGADTSFQLLQSSLQAMRARQEGAHFMVVSGDLVAHGFDCKYKSLMRGSTAGDYQDFVLKTISFIAGQLREAVPDKPLYLALGNNDSPCGDYQQDAGSTFFAEVAKIVRDGLPPAQQQGVTASLSAGGYYSVLLHAPMRHTRLIVLNDVLMSAKYKTCAGDTNNTAAAHEISWLENELSAARKARETVWVIGHIPPGVDPFSTMLKMRDVCGTDAPVMFLSSSTLADTLSANTDIIRLGIFGHSHMDEVRFLPAGRDAPRNANAGIAIKIVPSISPVDGNAPSFTVAEFDPASATLRDYQVIEASEASGLQSSWKMEYDYLQTYHAVDYSLGVQRMIADFSLDPNANTPASKAYVRNFFVGNQVPALKPLWPQYVCALANNSARAFATCACNVGK